MDFEKRVDQALGVIQADLTKLSVSVGENSVDLRNHMKRTDLNEARIQSLEKWLLGLLSTILLSVLAKLFF